MLEGSEISFRGSEADNWYHTFALYYPRDLLYSLLMKKGVTFAEHRQEFDLNYTLVLKELMLLATTKYLIDELKRGPASKVNLQPQIYNNDTSFADIYGGEVIKSKMREVISFLREPAQF